MLLQIQLPVGASTTTVAQELIKQDPASANLQVAWMRDDLVLFVGIDRMRFQTLEWWATAKDRRKAKKHSHRR